LIKQGAKLVESAQMSSRNSVWQGYPKRDCRSPEQVTNLLDKMGFDPCDIDGLIARSGLTAENVSAILLAVELEGKVAGLPGGLYQRVR